MRQGRNLSFSSTKNPLDPLPWHPAAAAAAAAAAGNHAPTAIMCVQGFNFPQVITSAEGWEFINEGTDKKPKTGYVTRTPGGGQEHGSLPGPWVLESAFGEGRGCTLGHVVRRGVSHGASLGFATCSPPQAGC